MSGVTARQFGRDQVHVWPLRVVVIALVALAISGSGSLADDLSESGGKDGESKAPSAPAPARRPVTTIVVKGFRFNGNTSVPTADLEGVVAPYVGKPCDLPKLREAADKVTAEYQRRGLSLAKAYLPAQDVKEGVIEIAILEGRVGEIHVDGNTNYSDEFIRSYLNEAVTGTAVTNEKLERGILLLNTEFKDLEVSAVLERGKEPGAVDIRANVDDRFPLRGTLSYNNFGNDFVSRHRFGAQVDWVNAVFPGGLLTLAGLMGEDPDNLLYGSGAYVVPINAIGTKIGMNGAYGDFQVAEDFADLGVKGELASGGAFISHPFIRNRTLGLSGELGFQIKDSTFYFLDEVSAKDRIRLVYGGVRADHVHWSGKTFASVNLAQGLGHFLDGLHEDDPDASRMNADNTFTKVSGILARYQSLTDMFSIFARVSGQWASDSLVAGEEWQVGGADTVRGYGPGEGAGDHGYNTSLEFRVAPLEDKEILQLLAFFDHGGAYRKREVTGQEDEVYLSGAGLGARSHLEYFIEADLRFDIGWPIDPHDNSLNEEPVIYASVSIQF